MSDWNEGAPPAGIDVAWLRMELPTEDGEPLRFVVLGVHDGEWWAVAGDYKGESYLDTVDGSVTGWLPHQIPTV